MDAASYLVWLENDRYYYLYDIQPVKDKFEMEKIEKLEDGEVYKMGISKP